MEVQSKQAYAAPQLTIFGNVERITQTWNVGGDLSGCDDHKPQPPRDPNCPPAVELS